MNNKIFQLKLRNFPLFIVLHTNTKNELRVKNYDLQLNILLETFNERKKLCHVILQN